MGLVGEQDALAQEVGAGRPYIWRSSILMRFDVALDGATGYGATTCSSPHGARNCRKTGRVRASPADRLWLAAQSRHIPGADGARCSR